MHGLVSGSNFGGLQTLFTDPRIQKLVDINTPEPMTGETVLHRAVDQNDYDMVTWCLKMKADPLLRDRRGKLAVEKAKSEKIKQLLKSGESNCASNSFQCFRKEHLRRRQRQTTL
jgi:ankyrin repeat protein